MPKIPRTETPQSSNIAFFEYDGRILTVGFKRKAKGAVEETIDSYEHHGGDDEIAQREIGDHAQAMLAAHQNDESVGQYFSRNIRGKYQVRKLEPPKEAA